MACGKTMKLGGLGAAVLLGLALSGVASADVVTSGTIGGGLVQFNSAGTLTQGTHNGTFSVTNLSFMASADQPNLDSFLTGTNPIEVQIGLNDAAHHSSALFTFQLGNPSQQFSWSDLENGKYIAVGNATLSGSVPGNALGGASGMSLSDTFIRLSNPQSGNCGSKVCGITFDIIGNLSKDAFKDSFKVKVPGNVDGSLALADAAVHAVPEPSDLAMFGGGLMLLGGLTWWLRKNRGADAAA